MSEFIDIEKQKPVEAGQYLVIMRGMIDIKLANFKPGNLEGEQWNLKGIYTRKVTHWFKCPPYPAALHLNALFRKASDVGLTPEEKIKLCELLQE